MLDDALLTDVEKQPDQNITAEASATKEPEKDDTTKTTETKSETPKAEAEDKIEYEVDDEVNLKLFIYSNKVYKYNLRKLKKG